MTSSRLFNARLLSAVLFTAAVLTATARSQTSGAAAVQQIDTECNAIQDAVMALHPIHVAYRSGNWVVLSAQQAYYSSDEKLIQKSAIFEENDPLVAKTIESLPSYSVLHQ